MLLTLSMNALGWGYEKPLTDIQAYGMPQLLRINWASRQTTDLPPSSGEKILYNNYQPRCIRYDLNKHVKIHWISP